MIASQENPTQPVLEPSIDPAGWHQSPDRTQDRCPVCGLPRACFPSAWNRLHRARRGSDPPGVKWLVKARRDSVYGVTAAGDRLPQRLAVSDETRERIRQAARQIAFGVPRAIVARGLGIDPDSLRQTLRSYPDLLAEEVRRARKRGRSALRVPIEPERKDAIPAWVREAAPKAAAMIAGGMSAGEAAAALELVPRAIEEWAQRYPDFWQPELARAREVAAHILRQKRGLPEGLYHPGDDLRDLAGNPSPEALTWEDLRRCYQDDKFPSLARRSQDRSRTVFDHFERAIPKGTKLSLLTPGTFALLQRDLRQRGLRDTTIATTLRTLKGILSWAVKRDMLPKVPSIDMPRQPRGRRFMRGRPLTAAEFDAMLEAVPSVVACDVAAWRHYLTGLWLSGLRVGESRVLSWDPDEAFSVDLAGRHPRFRIRAEAQKSYRDETFPLTPDFAAFLFETPEQDRRGPVFTLLHPRWRTPIKGRESVGKIVAKIGRAAGVVTDRRRGKYATAHDLRRSFGTRWAPRIMPAVLQRLMRHSSIVTTLTYYVDLDADGLADGLWRDFGPGQRAEPKALDAMPLPGAFTEAMGANGNGNGHNQGDAPDGRIAAAGEPGRKALDQLTSLLHGLSLSPTVQAQILALAAAGDQGPAPAAALSQTT